MVDRQAVDSGDRGVFATAQGGPLCRAARVGALARIGATHPGQGRNAVLCRVRRRRQAEDARRAALGLLREMVGHASRDSEQATFTALGV